MMGLGTRETDQRFILYMINVGKELREKPSLQVCAKVGLYSSDLDFTRGLLKKLKI